MDNYWVIRYLMCWNLLFQSKKSCHNPDTNRMVAIYKSTSSNSKAQPQFQLIKSTINRFFDGCNMIDFFLEICTPFDTGVKNYFGIE